MINMFRKNVGRPLVLIIQFITGYIIKLALLHLCFCYSNLNKIIFGLNMMQMNREWMNADRRSPEYIAVRHGYPWVPTDQAHGRPRQVGSAYQKTRQPVSGPNRPSW
jgi:hypothetical protein